MSVKITVNETILRLKEKNKNPKKMFNKNELTEIVLAMMNDKDYITKQAVLKSGEVVVKDRTLGKEFASALVDVLKGVGLKQAEAEALVESYKIPKSLAASVVDVVHAADYLYMDNIKKGIKFIGGNTDAVQTLFMGVTKARTHGVPKTAGDNSEQKKVAVKDHNRLQLKTKVNPLLKTLIKDGTK